MCWHAKFKIYNEKISEFLELIELSVILNIEAVCVIPDCYDRLTCSTAHSHQMMIAAADQNHHHLYSKSKQAWESINEF